jgi:hypothetical protein
MFLLRYLQFILLRFVTCKKIYASPLILFRMDMVHLPGKGTGARRVPLLLQPSCVAAMNALVEHRHYCGIPDSNIYFFATSASGYLNGWQALDNVARAAKVEQPELIHSTLLRKYMATVAQVSERCFSRASLHDS